jgi:lysophospholipase L1-like esterase
VADNSKIGLSDIDSLYVGAESASKIYLGTDIVWPTIVSSGEQDYTSAYTAPTVTVDSAITSDSDSSLPTGAWAYPDSSTAFRYLGVDAMTDTADGDNTYKPNPAIVQNGSAYRPYSVKFNITGTTFWVRVKPLRANSTLRVRVNNKWDIVQETITNTNDPDYPGTANSNAATSLAAVSAGDICYVKVVFTEAGPHTIQLDMNYRFGGVYVPSSATLATATVGSLPIVPSRRVYGLSASLFGGISQQSESPYGNTTSPLFRAAYSAGWTNVFDDSIGGSGYGASPSYLGRIQSTTIQNRISDRRGDVFIMDGGVYNDLGSGFGTTNPGTATSGFVHDRAAPVFQLLRSTAPNMNIIAIGIPLAPAIVDKYKDLGASESQAEDFAINGSGSTYGLIDYNNVLRQVAADNGVFYYEPIVTDRRVWDTNGALLGTLPSGAGRMPDYPTVPASASGTTYIHTDGVHPRKAGTFVIAKMYSDAFNIMKTSSNWKNPTN